jgi:Domain of Unknown Function (DUF1259)
MHGVPVGKEMGINTWASFGGTDEAAVIDGDFAMLENELQPVLRAMRKEGINIVAIHQPALSVPALLGQGQSRRPRTIVEAGARCPGSGEIMRKLVLLGLITAAQLVGATMASRLSAETASFETDAVGGPPRGWLLTMTGRGAPKWTVEKDDGGGAVLKQSGKATYPLALREGTNLRDGFVEVKFKPISGSEDRAGGIVWRAKDANNYYVVRANALEDNVVLYKTVNGVRSSLDLVGQKGGYGVKTAVPANQWHTLRVEFAGARFNVVFNGKPLFAVEDGTFPEAGMVGLWTKADSVTLFSGFTYGEPR